MGARTATRCLLDSAFFTPCRRLSRHRTYSLPTPTHGNTSDKCHGSFRYSSTMDAPSISLLLYATSLWQSSKPNCMRAFYFTEIETKGNRRATFDRPDSLNITSGTSDVMLDRRFTELQKLFLNTFIVRMWEWLSRWKARKLAILWFLLNKNERRWFFRFFFHIVEIVYPL